MLDAFFITVNEWMTAGSALAAVGAFLWGMVSVLLSPCHMASIPLMVSYVAGQEAAIKPRQASGYAGAFTAGLFITIALIGIVCAGLGRMLGDVGPYWSIAIGAVLLWVALGMMGVQACGIASSRLYRLKVKGLKGALVLGLAYGLLSGSCTFGFIAPLLAVVTVQQQVATGVLLMVLFAIGHCLPIVIAGSSMAAVRRLMENRVWQGTADWFRKGAGVMIALLAGYFIFSPFVSS